MKWTNDRSKNVEDRRGTSGGGGVVFGGGLGTIIIAAIVFFLGGDPSALLSSSVSAGGSGAQTEQRQLTKEELTQREFIEMITVENEQTWQQVFAENNLPFRPAKVVMFDNPTTSRCGAARSEMGPFYCPADETIYIDLSFFNELATRYGAKVGEFSVAYVMAHEYGHHIQTLLGVTGKVNEMRASGRYTQTQMNQVSVATELQADFYAGLWAKRSNDRENFLEPQDIEQAISAAEAVGDDNIQKRSQGYVHQESFTHGSSVQRKEWFMRGYQTGDIRQGDTFSVLLK